MGAIFKGELSVARVLVDVPCSPDQRNGAGQTAAMYAALFQRQKLLVALRQRGADLDATYAMGNSAASLARGEILPRPAQVPRRPCAGARRSGPLALQSLQGQIVHDLAAAFDFVDALVQVFVVLCLPGKVFMCRMCGLQLRSVLGKLTAERMVFEQHRGHSRRADSGQPSSQPSTVSAAGVDPGQWRRRPGRLGGHCHYQEQCPGTSNIIRWFRISPSCASNCSACARATNTSAARPRSVRTGQAYLLHRGRHPTARRSHPWPPQVGAGALKDELARQFKRAAEQSCGCGCGCGCGG